MTFHNCIFGYGFIFSYCSVDSEPFKSGDNLLFGHVVLKCLSDHSISTVVTILSVLFFFWFHQLYLPNYILKLKKIPSFFLNFQKPFLFSEDTFPLEFCSFFFFLDILLTSLKIFLLIFIPPNTYTSRYLLLAYFLSVF